MATFHVVHSDVIKLRMSETIYDGGGWEEKLVKVMKSRILVGKL
jgi:hypothetical protein